MGDSTKCKKTSNWMTSGPGHSWSRSPSPLEATATAATKDAADGAGNFSLQGLTDRPTDRSTDRAWMRNTWSASNGPSFLPLTSRRRLTRQSVRQHELVRMDGQIQDGRAGGRGRPFGGRKDECPLLCPPPPSLPPFNSPRAGLVAVGPLFPDR